MATQFDQGIVVPLTVVSDPFGLKPLTSNLLVVNTVPQKSFFINITGSLNNIVIPNETNRPMSASLVVSSATGDPTTNILSHEVLFSSTTPGNLTIPSANISISITSSFNLNDKIILRVVGNHNSFTTNNIINPTSFDSNLSLNISSTPNPSDTSMVLEPYFEGKPFIGSSADVTSGNIFRNIPNPFLQDIDYSKGPIPVNNQALISGSAQKGTVPESYYTSLAQTNIRYKGSKIQSTTINEYINSSGSTDFGNSFNIGNYGKSPSINVFNTGIFEFQWGGGTTPEIMDWGAFKIGKILQVSSKDLVKTINPSANLQTVQVLSRLDFNSSAPAPSSQLSQSIPQVKGDYYQILNSSNPINSEVSVALYTGGGSSSNPTVPPTTKILTSEFGVPTRSSFMYFTDANTASDTWSNGTSVFDMYQSANIYRVTSDYTPGSTINPVGNGTGDGMVNIIQRDINAGERWFFTFFTNLENTGTFDSSILEPYNGGYTSKNELGNYIDPFGFKGVYEILGVWEPNSTRTRFQLDKPNLGGSKKMGGSSSTSLGFLMWKARAAGKNEFIMVQDSVTGGVGYGALTGRYSPEYLTQNFEAITKEYGSNQTG